VAVGVFSAFVTGHSAIAAQGRLPRRSQLRSPQPELRTRLEHAGENFSKRNTARLILRGEAGFFRAINVEHADHLAVTD
jgi:hypothetical protein